MFACDILSAIAIAIAINEYNIKLKFIEKKIKIAHSEQLERNAVYLIILERKRNRSCTVNEALHFV